MTILNYDALDKTRRDHWRDSIVVQAWSASGFLASTLAGEHFHDFLSDDAHLLPAVDGDCRVGFCTYAHQAEIPAPQLFPWIGFVYSGSMSNCHENPSRVYTRELYQY